jgi:hypothetical protein
VKVIKHQDAKPMDIKVQEDVRAQLTAWAQANLTSMSAEIARSVRDRAAREARDLPEVR